MTRGEYCPLKIEKERRALQKRPPFFLDIRFRHRVMTVTTCGFYIFFIGAFLAIVIFVILHILQQYIVLPLTFTARVLTLVFMDVIGMFMPIFLQAGQVTPAIWTGFLADIFVIGAANEIPITPRLKLHTANAASFFIV